MYKLALLSFHGCPVARLGERDTGGMNVYVLQLAREFGRRGHHVDVFTRCHDPRDSRIVKLGEGARVIHLAAGPPHKAKEGLYEHIPQFIDSLCAFQRAEGLQYDLLHSHYWLSGQVGMALSRRWGVPHTATFHTLARAKLRARAGEREPQLRTVVEKKVLHDADAVVVSTEEEREDLVRLYRARRHKVWVVPAGVDLELFTPLDKVQARRRLGLSEKRVILYVGRIEPLKGLDLLLRALTLLEDAADTRLLVVGGNLERGDELGRLRSMAAALGIGHMVTFIGSVNQDELPNYYSASDVFVIPSYYESFGLAALEAMSCGTPVIASRVGGLKTFVQHGQSGYLVPWHCPEPFAQRLDVLLSNPVLRERMGRAARTKAQQMGWGRAADRLLELYSCMIGDAVGSAAGA